MPRGVLLAALAIALIIAAGAGALLASSLDSADATAVGMSSTGPHGPKGDAGASGKRGDAGSAGPRGDIGAAGARGQAGSDGAKGKAGADGLDGKAGIAGDAGLDGDPGTDGVPGAPGTPGEAGAPGAPGPQGPAGADGAHGTVSAITEVITSNVGNTAPSQGLLPAKEERTLMTVTLQPGRYLMNYTIGLFNPALDWPINIDLFTAGIVACRLTSPDGDLVRIPRVRVEPSSSHPLSGHDVFSISAATEVRVRCESRGFFDMHVFRDRKSVV